MAQNRPTNAPPQGEEPSSAPRPKWTIMIYLAGDNNLSANSIDILKDLEDAFPDDQPNDEIRVIACFDPNTPRPRGARYVEINHRRHKGGNGRNIRNSRNGQNGQNGQNIIPGWGLHSDLVPSGEQGDKSVTAPNFSDGDNFKIEIPAQDIPEVGLRRFLDYTLKNHEADAYMLILFGHGSAVAGNTFLADDNPPSFLRLTDFATVLSERFSTVKGDDKPALDILACDNCMMNGIETAYQIKDSVRYVIGSQGLMLAVGWQFRKIIEKIRKLEKKDVRTVAHAVCDVCARDLLDFALMDRSSEQSLLDLSTLDRENNLVTAIRQLSTALQDGLALDDEGLVLYPAIRDAVKLARLDAQSYFDETFVDLYDFCRLLLSKCNNAVKLPTDMSLQVVDRSADLSSRLFPQESKREEMRLKVKELFLLSDVMQKFQTIAESCARVLKEIKFLDANRDLKGNFVVVSYYIGPDLQYSNGVSIYFPWTMPDGPIIFSPMEEEITVEDARANGDRARSTGPKRAPRRFELKTPFDEYTKYAFAGKEGGDWTSFLVAFFRATLRNVRLSDYEYETDTKAEGFITIKRAAARAFRSFEMAAAPALNLHKTSSDMGSGVGGGDNVSRIKNYPRRFYLSPADRRRRCHIPGETEKPGEGANPNPELPCVSYLGWNLRGLVATQVGLRSEERVNRVFMSPPVSPAVAELSPLAEAVPNGGPAASPLSAPEVVAAENE